MKRRVFATVLVAILTFSLYGCSLFSPFSHDVYNAINDGTITHNMIEKEVKESGITSEQKEYVAEKLTEYQENNEIGKALSLIWALTGAREYNWKYGVLIDGESMAASEDFVNWIKQAVLSGNSETKEYQFDWDANDEYNMFRFKKIGDESFDSYDDVYSTRKDKDNRSIITFGKGDSTEKIKESFCNIEEQYSIAYEKEQKRIAEEKNNTSSNTSGSSSSSTSSGRQKCDQCNGTGRVKYYYGSSSYEAALNGHEDSWYGQCGSCQGTGYKRR